MPETDVQVLTDPDEEADAIVLDPVVANAPTAEDPNTTEAVVVAEAPVQPLAFCQPRRRTPTASGRFSVSMDSPRATTGCRSA